MSRKPTGGSELPSSQINDPFFPSAFSESQISYALPQWLVPERYKDKQSSQNNSTTKTRIFSVPLPEVSVETMKAVKEYLMKHNPPQKAGMKDSERKLKELKQEEKQASSKAKAAKDNLAQALFARSEKLKEIRKAHELETSKAMEDLETTIREEMKKEDIEIEQKIKEECRLEYEQKFEEEMVHKRKREQEEDEKEQAEVASAVKKAKEEKEGNATVASDADGKDAGQKGKVDSTSSTSKVEALENKQADTKEKIEKLSEKKSEMIWLLKQVIKQEALQKMKMKKLKRPETK